MGSSVMGVLFRPLTPNDLAAAVGMQDPDRSAFWTERVFRDELAADNRVYLAAEDAGLVGFGGLMLVGEEAHVTNLLVSPDARRRGIGLGLMLRLIDAAVDLGASHITLEVRSRNHAARTLYAKLGLVPVGMRRGYYQDDDALILWAHDIDGPEYRSRLEALR